MQFILSILNAISQWAHQLTLADKFLLAYFILGMWAFIEIVRSKSPQYNPTQSAKRIPAEIIEEPNRWFTLLFGLSLIIMVIGFVGGWIFTLINLLLGKDSIPLTPFWVGLASIALGFLYIYFVDELLVPLTWAVIIRRKNLGPKYFRPTTFPSPWPFHTMFATNLICALLIALA